MNLYVGTSGYAYKEWKGKFYPKEMPESGMLRFYGEHFGAVEINNTFYRMPKAEVLEHWAAEVPEGFQFVLKASRRITHFQRLVDADHSVEYLFRVAQALGERLGPILFQTPPDLKMDSDRLRAFLERLPAQCRAAFEFRHASWFVDEIFELLREYRAALCYAEAENDLDVPLVSTAPWGYLRLRRPDYDDGDLARCLDRVAQENWRQAFVFFKHEDEAKGPEMAMRFLKLAEPMEVRLRQAA